MLGGDTHGFEVIIDATCDGSWENCTLAKPKSLGLNALQFDRFMDFISGMGYEMSSFAPLMQYVFIGRSKLEPGTFYPIY
mmetsp:Transcript_11434/g.28179  ORF Transcript_11434/g.28179 Transcript_11434/m.28179 type:complete len:80 (-) Transcript_11434:58-297(-)